MGSRKIDSSTNRLQSSMKLEIKAQLYEEIDLINISHFRNKTFMLDEMP